AALQVVLGEVGEILVANVVTGYPDLEAAAAVRALGNMVDRLDVARVEDVERDERRVPIGGDERPVAGRVEGAPIVDLPGRPSLRSEPGHEGAELRVGDRVALRADDHDVVEVPCRVERKRALFETLRLPKLGVACGPPVRC